MSTTLKLSDEALALLAIHFDRRSLSMGGPNPEPLPGKTLEETRAAYRELVAAGLMMPLHSFVGGKESLYRLTDEAMARRGELTDLFVGAPPRR